jgi:hypothetical protein
MRGVRDIKSEIDRLTNFIDIAQSSRVMALINQIRDENKDKVIALREELKQVEANKKAPKPRWPDNTPQAVKDLAFQEFRGTTEFEKYRIHCWNDKAFWVSWPSGGYSDNGGWHPTPATFTLLSLTEKKQHDHNQPKFIKDIQGRVSMKTMQDELDKLNVTREEEQPLYNF